MIEEQINRDTRPRDQLSGPTFMSTENLKKLYNLILQSEIVEDYGIPRTIVIYYNAMNPTPKLAPATSPEKWWSGIDWAAMSRQSRLGIEGQQVVKNLVNHVDNRVREDCPTKS